MIADRFRNIVGSFPIFLLPFTLPSATSTILNGGPAVGVRWEDAGSWVPKREGDILVGTWARAPYPALTLVSADDASMISLRAATREDPDWPAAYKEFSLDGEYHAYDHAHTLVWAYLVAPIGDHVLINPVRFAIGDDVLPDVMATWLAKEPEHERPRAVLRERLERAYARAGRHGPHAPISFEAYYAGYHLGASAISARVVAALALLNCRNVVPQVVEPRQDRASRRRGELPPYRYHVLVIGPTRGRGRTTAEPHEPESHVAVHWVRGHFKEFTAERPLFGRRTGLYWWQPHLAGRAPRIVEKDYRLKSGQA